MCHEQCLAQHENEVLGFKKMLLEKTAEGQPKFGGKKEKSRDGGLRNIDKPTNMMNIFDTLRISSRIAKQI